MQDEEFSQNMRHFEQEQLSLERARDESVSNMILIKNSID
jgi:hypothetical protein